MQNKLITFTLGQDQEFAIVKPGAVSSFGVVKFPLASGIRFRSSQKLFPQIGQRQRLIPRLGRQRVSQQSSGGRIVPIGECDGFRIRQNREVENMTSDAGKCSLILLSSDPEKQVGELKLARAREARNTTPVDLSRHHPVKANLIGMPLDKCDSRHLSIEDVLCPER